jgi:linoleoyl-CoA desaturase
MKNHKTMLSMIEPYRMHKTLEGASVPKPDVKQNDFLEACKAMMQDHFVTGPGAKKRYPAEHKPSWNRVLWCFLPAAFMMVTFWAAWQAGKWWSFTIAIAHWVLGVNTSHDGGHFAMSKRPAVNWFYLLLTEPLGFHPFVWLHQHDKMHHQNPNDAGRDVDLDHFHPMRLSPRQSHQYKNLVAHLLRYSYSSFYICVGYPLWWIGIKLPFPALKALPIEKQFKTPAMVALGAFCCAVSLYVCIQPWYHCVLGDYSIFKALAFSTFPWLLTAAVFIAFTQVNHLQAECFLPAVLDEPNAIKRQVTTAMDYKQDSIFWQVMTGGINIQSMHHCFPSVCSANFVDVYPKFVQVCEDHNCKINMKKSWVESMTGMISHMWNLNSGDFAVEV